MFGEIPTFVWPVVAVIVVIAAIVAIVKSMWRVAEPNQALIISGGKSSKTATDEEGEDLGFKIVTGKGTLVIPGLQVVRRLSLDLHQADLDVECVTKQGIEMRIRGTVIYKIGDNYSSIANAARRFLDQQNEMDTRVHKVFAGHLRSIVGSLTVEEMIGDRSRLASESRDASGSEMAKLGLVIDSLQIQEIDDPTGYIQNLSRPFAAAVAKEARIASANADREAIAAEQLAATQNAEAARNTNIAKAEYAAEVQSAEAKAAQAGPLAAAEAEQAVLEQQALVAARSAEVREKQLEAEIRKPADAEAYAAKIRAEGERDATIANADAESARVTRVGEATAAATRVTGLANAEVTSATGLAAAEVTRAKGLAEGEAIAARSQALAENQEAVISQQLADRFPEIIASAAHLFDNVDNFTVLNGAEGVTEAVSTVVSNAVTMFQGMRGAFFNEAEVARTKGITTPRPSAPRSSVD